jgi:peptidoglycan/xylan/chitin deacetylase (PgdA/CDA1 family)
MGRRRVLTALLVVALAFLLTPTIAYAVNLMPVYRFYNVRSGVHLYTADEAEKASIQENLASTYRYEGVGYSIDTSDAVNSSPLYRFYNFRADVHFYTADEAEKNSIQKNLSSTYRYEGVAYKVSLAPTSMPVYRFVNVRTGVHFYTATQGERDWLIANLTSPYRYEGVAFYITGSVPAWTPPATTDPPIWQKYRGVQIDGVKTKIKVIALDFDDGPINSNTIIDIFTKYGGKPTFFWVGSRITSAPAEYAVAHGVEINAHSWVHQPLPPMSDSAKLDQINRVDARIAQFTGKKPLWFRAPFNSVNGSLLNLLASTQHLYAHQYLMTGDYKLISATQLVKVFDKPTPGAIYLSHEGLANTVAALPTILTNLKKKGFQVVTNTELLRYGTPAAKLAP